MDINNPDYRDLWFTLRKRLAEELFEEEKDENISDYACGLHEALGIMDELDYGISER